MHEATAIAERDPGLQDTGEQIIPGPARDSIDSEELIQALRMQVQALERKLADSEGNRQALRLEMEAFGQEWNARLETIRKALEQV
jgi:hypothetical protein